MSSFFVKSTMLSLLLLAAFHANAADGQQLATSSRTSLKQDSSSSFAVNADPIWLALGGFGLKAEYFATRTVSLGVEGMLIPKYHVTDSSTDNNSSDLKTDYMYEHSELMLTSNIMLIGTLNTNGLYIEPALGYQTTRISEYYGFSGELNSPMARATMGYQWVLMRHMRLAAGGGFEVTSSSDVVVKDSSGQEVLREKSNELGGVALDLQIGFLF